MVEEQLVWKDPGTGQTSNKDTKYVHHENIRGYSSRGGGPLNLQGEGGKGRKKKELWAQNLYPVRCKKRGSPRKMGPRNKPEPNPVWARKSGSTGLL